MTHFHGSAETAHGERYLQQLCKHWAHKFPVEIAPGHGTIELPLGRVTLSAGSDRLDVELEPVNEADEARLRTVVEEHLNRFAFREAPLPFTWTSEETAR